MRTWYEFKAKADANETEVLLYDEIGGFGVSAARFIAELSQVPPTHRIVLRIHSPGGSVVDGNAIGNALKAHRGGLITQVDGLAASMAAVLTVAGKPARMAENALLMIHNVSTYAQGDPDDLRRQADIAEKIQEGIVRAFADRTGQPQYKIREMMDAETWMDAREAKELGFIDEIGAPLQMAASFDLTRFRNAPGKRGNIDSGKEGNMDNDPITPEEKSFLQKLIAFFKQAPDAAAQPALNFVTELVEARNEVKTLKAEIEKHGATIVSLTKERDAALAKVVTPEALEEQISKAVTARLAAAGTDPIQRDPAAASGTSFSEQLEAIKSPAERTAFFRAHRAELHAENLRLHTAS